jgi:hypothetical protein
MDEEKRRVLTKFFSKKRGKDMIFVGESSTHYQAPKEYVWSKNLELFGIGGQQLSPGSVVQQSWHYFTLMMTRILITVAFGWKKLYARSCV